MKYFKIASYSFYVCIFRITYTHITSMLMLTDRAICQRVSAVWIDIDSKFSTATASSRFLSRHFKNPSLVHVSEGVVLEAIYVEISTNCGGKKSTLFLFSDVEGEFASQNRCQGKLGINFSCCAKSATSWLQFIAREKKKFVYYQQKFLILFFHDTANTFRLFLLLPRAANLHNEKTFPSDHSSQPLIFTIQTLVVLLSGSLIYNVNWIFNQWDYVAGVYVIYLCWGEATQSCTHRRLMEKSK